MASREITEEQYKDFSKKYVTASTSINKDEEMEAVASELEHDFELLGSTAIEDKLQEDVGETIYGIRQAGI